MYINCSSSLEHEISSIDRIFLLQTNSTPQETVLITQLYTRALVNHQEHERAFTLLQLQYAKYPEFGESILYLYAKLVIKSNFVAYIPSAQCALYECLVHESKRTKFDFNEVEIDGDGQVKV